MKAGDIFSSSELAERFRGPIQADHTWTMIFMGHMKNEVSLLFIALLLDVPSLQVSWRRAAPQYFGTLGGCYCYCFRTELRVSLYEFARN